MLGFIRRWFSKKQNVNQIVLVVADIAENHENAYWGKRINESGKLIASHTEEIVYYDVLMDGDALPHYGVAASRFKIVTRDAFTPPR